LSTLHHHALDCPACGHTYGVMLAESLNVARAPIARTWALEDTINRGVCPSCGAHTRLEARVQYVDTERGLWLFKFLGAEREELAECEEIATRVLDDTMGPGRAPAFVVVMRETLSPTVCFSYEELSEKAWCAELGLDDRVVEVLKHHLLTQRPELLTTGVEWLRLMPSPDPAQLAFAAYRGAERIGALDEGAANVVLVERSAYDELLAQRGALAAMYPALFTRPYRSLERYRLETAAMQRAESAAEGARLDEPGSEATET
jgi:hypothetical protein